MTQFEQARQAVANGMLQTPSVVMGNSEIDYFLYQLTTHRFNLKVMAGGFKFKGITFTEIKNYYGLKGRSAKECLPQFEKIMEDYKKEKGHQ